MRLRGSKATLVAGMTNKIATSRIATQSRIDGSRVRNAMSVDVEDYFQVEAFANRIDRGDWDRFEWRVEQNTRRVLHLFSEQHVKATFFVLGRVAERCPGLVRRIVDDGHELASHGYEHYRVSDQLPGQFRVDVRRTKQVLEDVSGTAVLGYRAAGFSIGPATLWAHDILAEEGYRYSSSIYAIKHYFDGTLDAPRLPYCPRGDGFLEIPLTTCTLFGRNIPCSGGGFFRLLPYAVSRWAISRVNGKDKRPCVFYFHPWEIDRRQPRIAGISLKGRFRHYINLGRTEPRLIQLLRDFAWGRIDHIFFQHGVAVP